MHVTVISPERAVFDGPADAVVAPAYDGQVGILPRHAPFLTLLGSGTLTVSGGEAGRFRVAGAFLQDLRRPGRVVAASVEIDCQHSPARVAKRGFMSALNAALTARSEAAMRHALRW